MGGCAEAARARPAWRARGTTRHDRRGPQPGNSTTRRARRPCVPNSPITRIKQRNASRRQRYPAWPPPVATVRNVGSPLRWDESRLKLAGLAKGKRRLEDLGEDELRPQ